MHGGLTAVGSDGHLAGDRGTETEIERTDRFLATAHAIEEVPHVQFGQFGVTAVLGVGGVVTFLPCVST